MKPLFLWLFLLVLPMKILAAEADCPAPIVVQVAKGDALSPPEAGWQNVTLPDYWKYRWPDYSGSAWYRLKWHGHCKNMALMLDFLVMAGEVYLNGRRLWRDLHFQEPRSRSWNMVRYWQLPEGLLHDAENELTIHVVGHAINNAGLGAVTLGDAAGLYKRFEHQWWKNRTLLFINQVVSFVLACLALVVWLGWRKETVFGWYALSTFCWVGFTWFISATETAPFSDDLQMLRFSTLAYLLFQASFCRFTWSLIGLQRPWLVYGLAVWLALVLLLNFTATGYDGPFLAGHVGGLVFISNTLYLLWRGARRRAKREERWLAFGLLVLLLVAVHDVWVWLKMSDVQDYYSMYSCIGFLLLIAILLGLRVAESARRIERFNGELTQAVAQAETRLSDTLKNEHQLALANAQLQERLHLAHDLHDSLGGQIVRSIIQVEQFLPTPEQKKFLATLKLLRDDLRQIIDSGVSRHALTPPSPERWLAPLRYRFDSLSDELGTQIHWHLPAEWQAAPSAQQCLLLARVVEEALTNVLKHSQATCVNLRLTQDSVHALKLTIEDNGKGFDVTQVTQHGLGIGLDSMNARMKRMSGTLDIHSRPGHTCLAAWLPLNPNGA